MGHLNREIIQFLLAVRKHNFQRTSPAEARNALIRMPAEMKRDGTGVKRQKEKQDQYRCPGICSPSEGHEDQHMNKAQREQAGCAPASHILHTKFYSQIRCQRLNSAYSEPDT